MIRVTNLTTGEVNTYSGKLMVATNGMAFVKSGKRVLWCSASVDFVAEEVAV